jgi:hypothetical protein
MRIYDVELLVSGPVTIRRQINLTQLRKVYTHTPQMSPDPIDIGFVPIN